MKNSTELQKEVEKLSRADSGHAILTSTIAEQSLESLLLLYLDISDAAAEALFSGARGSSLSGKAALASW